MTNRKLSPEEQQARDNAQARITAHQCAHRIRQYWLDRGYDVPVEVKGSQLMMPAVPGGLPPPEMKRP